MSCSLFRFSKPAWNMAGLLAVLAIAFAPLAAQSAGDSLLSYDVREEVTLSGTVSSVVSRPARGMISGSHLLLTTVFGAVDVSLGRWGLQGKGTLSVTPGQQVEVTGVMKTLSQRQVLLARTVKVNGKVYAMRNQHGIPLSPQSRERAARTGESL